MSPIKRHEELFQASTELVEEVPFSKHMDISGIDVLCESILEVDIEKFDVVTENRILVMELSDDIEETSKMRPKSTIPMNEADKKLIAEQVLGLVPSEKQDQLFEQLSEKNQSREFAR